MAKLDVPKEETNGYTLMESKDERFFEDGQADIYIRGVKIGTFGIVHPNILKNFDIKFPVTLAEIDIEHIFNMILNKQLLQGKS